MKLPPESYVPLDHSNREHIKHIINTRWKKHRVGLILSLLAPLLLLAMWHVLACLFVYVIVIIFNVINTRRRFSDLYADLKRGEKLIIPFHPYPYCIPEVGRYYIQTNIDFYPYITIDKETYYWMDSTQVLYMEVAPKSHIIFNINAEEPPPVGETHPMLKTPSQIKERKRWN
jgi:hypothetical protein